MQKVKVTSLGTPEGGSKTYERFRGVDFSGDETKIDDSRSPQAINLIADEGGFPEKRVGWRTLERFEGCIAGIIPFEAGADGETTFIVHAGSKLYRWKHGEKTELLGGIKDGGRDASFFMNGKLYILTGTEYIVYDGETAKHVSEVAYVPTTSFGRKPSGGGTSYESVNLLTAYQINKFSADGESTVYVLDRTGLDSGFTPEVTVNGERVTVFSTDFSLGRITFQTAPAKPANEGTDNVTIKFRRTANERMGFIQKCTICATYGLNNDSRVFLSGNPDEPNREQYSGLLDPTYFPDTNYILVGDRNFPVMCYLKSQGELLVVKEDNRQEGTIWHHTAELVGETMTFPLREGLPGYGAVARYSAGNLLDDPMYLSPRGIYAPTMTQVGSYMQRALKCRSKRINQKLNKEAKMGDAISASWKGWYVLAIDGHAYVADGNQDRSDDGYEWYYWENIPAHVLRAHEQALYFGTADGRICRFNDDMVDEDNNVLMRAYNDDGAAIYAEWRSKLDTMDTPMRLKTMPKRGSGVHLKAYTRSAVDVYIRTEHDHGGFIRRIYSDRLDFNDIDFSRFTFSTVNNSMVPFRAKKKKWKAIQIVLKSEILNEGFGVHSVVIRYIFGNYAKR